MSITITPSVGERVELGREVFRVVGEGLQGVGGSAAADFARRAAQRRRRDADVAGSALQRDIVLRVAQAVGDFAGAFAHDERHRRQTADEGDADLPSDIGVLLQSPTTVAATPGPNIQLLPEQRVSAI